MTIIKTKDLRLGDVIRSPHFARAVDVYGHRSAAIVMSEKAYGEGEQDAELAAKCAVAAFLVYGVGAKHGYTWYSAVLLELPRREPLLVTLAASLSRQDITFAKEVVPEVEKIGEVEMTLILSPAPGYHRPRRRPV